MGTFEVLDQEEDLVVIRLSDAAGLRGLADLRWRLDTVLSGGATTLVVDVSELERFSSSTLAALLQARRICRARGGTVVLRSAEGQCTEMLARTGLLGLFQVEAAADRPPEKAMTGGGGRS